MAEYENNHYVQKEVLKHFADEENKIFLLDLEWGKLKKRPISSSFSSKNLYDQEGENPKKLEKDLHDKIEQLMAPIFNKLCKPNVKNIILTMDEIKTIKKYILIQIYRNKFNGEYYDKKIEGQINFLDFDRKEGESNRNVWIREIQTLLDNDIYDYYNLNMKGISKYSEEIVNGLLVFIKTNEEFCLNDLGYATDREHKSYEGLDILSNKDLSMIQRHSIKNEIMNNTAYLDNYVIMPISSHLAILLFHPMWKILLKESVKQGQDFILNSKSSITRTNSIIIKKYLHIPLVCEYDYIYPIWEITQDESNNLNYLLIKGAHKYIGFHSLDKFKSVLENYTIIPGIKYIKGIIEGIKNIKN